MVWYVSHSLQPDRAVKAKQTQFEKKAKCIHYRAKVAGFFVYV